MTDGTDYGVQGKNVWRLSDLSSKLAFLRAGLGWGHMPRWLVEEDVDAGRLVPIVLEGPAAGVMPFPSVYRSNAIPGPCCSGCLRLAPEAWPSKAITKPLFAALDA